MVRMSTHGTELPRRFSLGAALAGALAASACCLGPVCLAVLGVGSASAFGWLATYRPMMLALTAASLGFGFYLSYRKPKAVPEDACGCGPSRSRRVSRIALWIVAVLSTVVVVSPPLLARITAGSEESLLAGPLDTAVIHVQGVDCEACAAPIRKALAGAGGFGAMKLELSSKSVSVSYEPGARRPDVYVHAIEQLGYEASLVETRHSQQASQ
jgi:mercuric ion transport protein